MKASVTRRVFTKLISNWTDGHVDTIRVVRMFEIKYLDIWTCQSRHRNNQANNFNLRKEQSKEIESVKSRIYLKR